MLLRTARAFHKPGAQVTYPAKTNYVPDFSGTADGTALNTVAGWANYSSTSVVTSRHQIKSGKVTGSNSGSFTQPCGDTITARDTGTTDHFIEFVLEAPFQTGSDFQVVIGATDEKNCLCLHITFGATTPSSFYMSKVVAGTETVLQGISTATSTNPTGALPVAGDRLKFSTVGNRMFLTLNGVAMGDGTGVDITGFTKGTKVGFGSFDLSNAQFLSNITIGVHTAYATLDLDSAAWGPQIAFTQNWPAFWPGKIGVGATVNLAGNCAGSLLDLDYRVRNASSGAVVQDWARATNLNVVGTKWTAKAHLPMADTTTNPVYKLDVRAANDIDAYNTNYQPTTVGITVLSYGQSNAEGFTGDSAVTTPVSYANAYSCAPHSSSQPWWYGGSATSASSVPRAILWADRLAASIGIPVGVLISGRASYSIHALVTADTDPAYSSLGWWDNLINDLNSLQGNAAGLIYGVNWTQGEEESNQSGSFCAASVGTDYQTDFTTLIGSTRLRSPQVAVDPNIPIGITVTGQYSGDKGTDTIYSNYNYPFMRGVEFGCKDLGTGIYIASGLMDLKHATGDAFHFGEAMVEDGRRIGLSMAKALKASPLALGAYTGPDGRGPYVSGVTRAGSVITLTLNANGAAGFDQTAAGNLDAYDVYLASDPNQGVGQFPTLLTKSSTVLDTVNGKVTITLSADPGAAVKVRSFYGHWPERDKTATPAVNAEDITAIRARGTYSDGSSIPVEPIYTPLTSS